MDKLILKMWYGVGMDIDISADAEKAAADIARVYDQGAFKESLDYLRYECGIPMTQIADMVGVSRNYLYWWASGTHTPLNPFPMVVINRWAMRIKEERQMAPAAA